ncbi:MAG: hypothetical protein AB7H80_15300 [Candidatus Kapaibacterium sp.]
MFDALYVEIYRLVHKRIKRSVATRREIATYSLTVLEVLFVDVVVYWFAKLVDIEDFSLSELHLTVIILVLTYYNTSRYDFMELNWRDPSIRLSMAGRVIVLLCLLAIVGTYAYANCAESPVVRFGL